MSQVVFKDLSSNYTETNNVQIDNRRCFSYYDCDNNGIQIMVFDDGLFVNKHTEDYILELNLRENCYAKITNSEGIIKFDAKVVEFYQNNDILVMHYLVQDEDKIIEIKY